IDPKLAIRLDRLNRQVPVPLDSLAELRGARQAEFPALGRGRELAQFEIDGFEPRGEDVRPAAVLVSQRTLRNLERSDANSRKRLALVLFGRRRSRFRPKLQKVQRAVLGHGRV